MTTPPASSSVTAPKRIATVAVGVLTLAAVLLAVNQVFNLRFFMRQTLLQSSYLYLLAGLFLAIAFLVYPLRASWPRFRPTLLDMVLAVTALGCGAYFAATGLQSLNEGWEFAAPATPLFLSLVFWVVILEATRRAAGTALFVIVTLFSLYPVVADIMPGPIAGFAHPFDATIAFHILSSESSFGIPMNAFGALVLGFVLFGAALQRTGGGAFFNDIAFALVGGYRGGAAKVASVGSGLMGSVSGSVISNIMTTGAMTIPAMKRTGFTPTHAAAIEACASTGGVLMPPVMGATAFVMASFLGVAYGEIVLAALIPSALFYFSLIVQIDAFAARRGLGGIERSSLPAIGATLRGGWHYGLVFVLLIVLLIGFQIDSMAPFVATGVLLVANQSLARTRLSAGGLWGVLVGAGAAMAEIAAILAGVGLVVGAFAATGLSGTLANDLVFLAGGGLLTLLVMGALTSFVFGMGMTVTSCYIFLAVVLAPALIRAGLDAMAVHLFIMYWGMVSFITPPVALGAFAAASLAGTSPMRTGLLAMRLGSLIYLVPFFFVLEPALIGRGSAIEVARAVGSTAFGVWLLASGLQRYLAGLGSLGDGVRGWIVSALVGFGGLLVAMPVHVATQTYATHMTLAGVLCVTAAAIAVRLGFTAAPAAAGRAAAGGRGSAR